MNYEVPPNNRMDFSQLATGSYDKIADIGDQLMLQLASQGVAYQDEWPYAVHLLGHIYLNDLNSARFLWKSIPPSIKESRPEVVAVWKIGQQLWIRNYAGVYDAIRGFNWSAEIQDFIASFEEKYTRRMLELLMSAYSTISIQDTALFLEMNYENQACSGLGFANFGTMVHTHLVKNGFEADFVVTSSLLGMYAKCGMFGLAVQVFDEMSERDVACWNTVISCYHHDGKYEKASGKKIPIKLCPKKHFLKTILHQDDQVRVSISCRFIFCGSQIVTNTSSYLINTFRDFHILL